MKYEIKPTNKFQKDLKRIQKRGYDLKLISEIIKKLANYSGRRECHITPDWLLIYEYDEEVLYLYLTRTGSHSDLF